MYPGIFPGDKCTIGKLVEAKKYSDRLEKGTFRKKLNISNMNGKIHRNAKSRSIFV
jgi:hypothetical protein